MLFQSYGLESLKTRDLVYIHIEAPDEAGHEGRLGDKIQAIENIDRMVVGRILKNIKNTIVGEFAISILTYHPTPVKLRTHTSDPVPFAIYSSCGGRDAVLKYDENSAKTGAYGQRKGIEFMKLLTGIKNTDSTKQQ